MRGSARLHVHSLHCNSLIVNPWKLTTLLKKIEWKPRKRKEKLWTNTRNEGPRRRWKRWDENPSFPSPSGALTYCSSQHHSLYIISFDLGTLNLKWQNCFGTLEHSWIGVSLGRSLVTRLQVFTGTRSHISSGTSTTLSTTSSWQISSSSENEQDFPHRVIGSFSHLE